MYAYSVIVTFHIFVINISPKLGRPSGTDKDLQESELVHTCAPLVSLRVVAL